MFLWLKTLYRKRAVTWPFIFYTIIWTLSINSFGLAIKPNNWNEPTKIKELYTINADYDYYTEGG